MTTTSNITAERITVGPKTFVVLSIDGAEVDRLGGKRAERANAAVVDLDRNLMLGLRASVDAAAREAARWNVGPAMAVAVR